MTDANDSSYYTETIATFGDRVTAARESAGFTQKQLARQIGVKLKTIEGWENDQNEPRANKAQMLSGVLGVSLVWLLTGEGDGIPEPAADGELHGTVGEILTEMQALKVQLSQSTRKLSNLEKRLREVV